MRSYWTNYLTNNQHKMHLRAVIKPFYIILSIFGLFPYSVQLHSSKEGFNIIPKSIYLNFLCALINLVIIVLFFVLHIREINLSFSSSIHTGIMTEINYIMELLMLLVFCVITYTSVFTNRLKFMKILNKISMLIDGHKMSSEKVLTHLRYQVIILLGSLVLLLALQLAINFTRNSSVYKMFLVVFTFILPQMIQFTAIALFYLLVMMMVELLRRVRQCVLPPEGTVKFTTIGQGHELRELEYMYTTLLAVKQRVNHLFQAPILVTLMQSFHAMVSESHIIYHGLLVEANLEIHDIVNFSMWIIYQLGKIYVIAKAGNIYKLEMLKLCRAVYNIPTEKQDLRFFLEVQHLAALMSLPGKELTVYGYFPLDATLMFRVIASAGMYVIILVQFDKKT